MECPPVKKKVCVDDSDSSVSVEGEAEIEKKKGIFSK